MSLKSLTLLSLLCVTTNLLSVEVSIDATSLSGALPIFLSEGGLSHQVPENGTLLLEVENLPTIIEINSINKGKITTLKTIWLTGESLTIEGSVEENRFTVSPATSGRILSTSPEEEWKGFFKGENLANPSPQLLVYLRNSIKFQKTEDLQEVLNRLASEDQSFWAAEEIQLYLTELEKVGFDPENGTFQSLTASDKKGEKMEYKRPENKYLLIDFSSSGCRPCLVDIDQLVRLQSDFESELEILSIWDDPKLEAWLTIGKTQKDKITWTSLRDDSRAVFKKFEVDVYPTYLLIDPQGNVVKRWKGSGIEKVRKYLKK
ncbi:TlpA disulfide reductase family protein [Cryomorphaceae bacterium 1068]|nr:TlpA disulfide reductase family protein [Cryomorphaceae bacterium 1068]